MSDSILPTKASAKFLDYIGLGLVLAPIEVVGADFVANRETSPEEWERVAILMFFLVALAIGTWWENMKPGGPAKLASLDAIAKHPVTWLIGGLLRCPRFVHISWRPGRRMVILALSFLTARAISTHADRRLSMAWRAPGRRLPLFGDLPGQRYPGSSTARGAPSGRAAVSEAELILKLPRRHAV